MIDTNTPLNELTDDDWQTMSSELLEAVRHIDDVLDYGSDQEKEEAKQSLMIMFPQMFKKEDR